QRYGSLLGSGGSAGQERSWSATSCCLLGALLDVCEKLVLVVPAGTGHECRGNRGGNYSDLSGGVAAALAVERERNVVEHRQSARIWVFALFIDQVHKHSCSVFFHPAMGERHRFH